MGPEPLHPVSSHALSSAILTRLHGVWRSLVARFVRDEEVVGSNPATPTLWRRPLASGDADRGLCTPGRRAPLLSGDVRTRARRIRAGRAGHRVGGARS